jgi:hypothetical protein
MANFTDNNLFPVISPRGVPVSKSDDLIRIAALPRRQPLDLNSIEGQAMVEYVMNKYAKPNLACKCAQIDPQVKMGNRTCIKRLLPIQAWALYEIGIVKGMVGAIPVGAGKTLLSVMAALALNEPLALLLVPPNLLDQLKIDYQLIGEHFKVPGIIVHQAGGGDWRRLVPGAPILHVLPYSLLQGKNNSDWIERLAPNAIIADEVDGLADLGSARTKRIVRYYEGNERMTQERRAARSRTKFCCWTGSLADKSITEFAHLSAFALKDKSPLPLDQETVLEWARAVDAVPNPSPAGALTLLCDPGEEPRAAFGRRIRETMGFIVTATSEVRKPGSVELVQHQVLERAAPPLPAIIEEALEKVRDFKRPDTLDGADFDEELVEAMEQATCAKQVATGMFYKWIYPRGEPEDLIKKWLAARKLWHQEQRYKLFESLEYMDSPGLLEDAAKRAWGDLPPAEKNGIPLPEWKAVSWPAWRAVRDLVQPKTKAVRLHDFLIRDAADWALTNTGKNNSGIVWCSMVEFAQWLHELTGLPVHDGGRFADQRLRQETGQRSIIASIQSNHRGRNGLQYLFHKQLIAQVFASSRVGEQLLGRAHRQGQKFDVTTEIYLHTPEIKKSFKQALMRAKFNEELFEQKQKITVGWFGDENDE